MDYKLTADGKAIEMNDKGQPVMIKDGEEFGVDAIHLYTRLPEVNQESKDRKVVINQLKEQLEAFKGIEDPKAAREALQMVKTFEEKDLNNKKDFDKLKEELEATWKSKVTEQKDIMKEALEAKDNTIKSLQGDVFDAMVNSQFQKSPFFAGETRTTYLTSDVAAKFFGEYFKVEKNDEGKNMVVGYIDGKPILSQDRPGDYAKFDEAIPQVIKASGQDIMKNSSGSGGGGDNANFNGQTVSAKDPLAISRNAKGIADGTIKVV